MFQAIMLNASLALLPHSITLGVGQSTAVTIVLTLLTASSSPSNYACVTVKSDDPSSVLIDSSPLPINLHVTHDVSSSNTTMRGVSPDGNAVVYISDCWLAEHTTCGRGEGNTTDCGIDLGHTWGSVRVVKDMPLETFIFIVGWVYFVAWSVSFYPQLYLNWQRKSVRGLNFDFIALNLMGFSCYALYNSAMYWSTGVQSLFHDLHQRTELPVLLNDVIFSLHALVATALTALQCLMYERGPQRVSRICYSLLTLFAAFAVISTILAFTSTIDWFAFVTFISYIKLAVTLVKYIPQALMNYRRKSTVGWSIGNILLDCTGGSMSIMQMMLIAYNTDDWAHMFVDITKFGLGFFSIVFDLLFFYQHYVLYRNPSTTSSNNDHIVGRDPADYDRLVGEDVQEGEEERASDEGGVVNQ